MTLRQFDQVTFMPTIYVHADLDKVVTITRASGTWDWSSWTEITFECPDLSMTKTTANDVSVVDADSITVLLETADYSAVTATSSYVYRVVVNNGTNDFSAGEGKLVVVRPVA